MNELEHYDRGANLFYGSQQIKSLPLNSWDSYSKHFESVLRFSDDLAIFNKLATDHRWNTQLLIENELLQKKHIVVVTNANLQIVHASHNMIEMNGYTAEEVIGNTPKIFQGEETCAKTNAYISNAIRTKKPFEAIVLNYRKDGSPYKCWIKGQPIFNADKDVVHFIAYEKEVA